MKIVGFEQGSVTVKLNASECEALSRAVSVAAGSVPLAEALRVCARVTSAQSRQALTVRVVRAPLALVRQNRSIVSVD